MLTVAELQRERQARAQVNHETYKQLWRQAQDRIRARADNKGTDLAWQVPPLVPGRPVYAAAHAARYVSDKLRRGGFEVTVAAPQPDVQVLYISWKETPRRAPPLPPQQHRPAPPRRDSPPRTTQLEDATRTLEKLKARLSMR